MPLKLLRLAFIVVLVQLPLLLAQAQAEPGSPKILILGDSLSAGFGIKLGESWPGLLRQRLAENGYRFRVVNASISGDTTAGGRARLPAMLIEHRPAVVIIELGGNDGLRGQSLQQMHANLAYMIQAAQRSRARVLLVGMRLPPNYGLAYTEKFQAVYRDLANRYPVGFVPFLLDGVGGNDELMLPDLIHPRAKAQPVILENIWPHLKPLLAD